MIEANAPEDRPALFASLRYPGAGRYFLGLSLSMLGTWMQSIALSWLFVHELGATGMLLGLLGVVQFGPTLLLGAWAGALADRMDKRRLMLVTQIAMGCTALALAALDFANRESIAAVLVISGIGGLASAFDTPVRRSIIGDVVPKSALPNAMSLNTGVITSSRVLGMAMGGFVTKFAGTSWCFLANGLSYLAMLAALSSMTNRRHASAPPTSRGGARDAVRHVWETPMLRVAMMATTVVATFAFNYQVTFPLLVADEFGREADGLGALFAITSVGSFAGALTSARRRAPSLQVFLFACIGMGVSAMALAASPGFLAANVCSVPMGYCGGLLMSQLSGMLTAHSDSSMRSRILALQSVVFLGSTPIGGPIIGFIADHFGPRWSVASGGFFAAAAGVLGLAKGRRLRPPAQDVPAGSEQLSGVSARS